MYALIGYPLGHSFSADFFNSKFAREGIDDEYRLCPLKSFAEFPDFLERNPRLEGFNVTIPYKVDVIDTLDFISEEAHGINAVNVVKIFDRARGRAGLPCRLAGYNTDAPAFLESLKPMLRDDIDRGLVLGTGGASKAVVYALRKLGVEPQLVSRSPEDGEIGYDALDRELIQSHLLIINTTPLGMSPKVDTAPPLPYQYIGSDHICFDLIYNPEVTKFMSLCRSRGAVVKNGLEMLHLQALKSWEIWNGISRPSLRPLPEY